MPLPIGKQSFLNACNLLETKYHLLRSIYKARVLCYINRDTKPSISIEYDDNSFKMLFNSKYFDTNSGLESFLSDKYLKVIKVEVVIGGPTKGGPTKGGPAERNSTGDTVLFYSSKYGDVSDEKFDEFMKLKKKKDRNPYEKVEYIKLKNIFQKLPKEDTLSPDQYKIMKDSKISYPSNLRKGTITITFGDVAENHVGMQKIGDLAEEGYTFEDLLKYKKHFDETELIYLNEYLPDDLDVENAYLLIIRKGVDKILQKIDTDTNILFDELLSMTWDKKAKMKGKVVNKKARYNLCFSNEDQDPDYDNGKGRIVSWNKVPLLHLIKSEIDPDNLLTAEGNYYYNSKTCYIGAHGDSERRKVIALRLGETMDITFQWYYRHNKIGKTFTTYLNNGDIYIMSSKAVGTDWRTSGHVLRHSVNSINNH